MRKRYILYATTTILSLFIIDNTSALSYQGSTEVKFTFNPTLSINISSSDLVIDNLTPGTTGDSNIINVSVATNASHGYTLSATVGDSLHNNTNLTHTNDTNTFSSIATNSSLPSLTTDNTWGYSYKLSNNTTWNYYSGLSNETSKTLINTDSQLAKPIDFKIAAKASSIQASGTYTNTINFIAISKPIPKTIEDIAYMQTFGELLPTDLQSVKDSMTLNQDYILKDSRDEKEYYITKLEDGHIWMTQNLDLDIDDAETYTHYDTDLGWTTSNSNVTWRPIHSTIEFAGDTVESWVGSDFEPYSASKTDSTNIGHASFGNYYNWSAAIASNDSSDDINDNSICPSGWILPIATNENNDFNILLQTYGISKMPDDLDKMIHSPLYFARPGDIAVDGLLGGYANGYYWSKTTIGRFSRALRFYSNRLNPADNVSRGNGLSVRCLAR